MSLRLFEKDMQILVGVGNYTFRTVDWLVCVVVREDYLEIARALKVLHGLEHLRIDTSQAQRIDTRSLAQLE